ncbi:MAG: DNA repair protein RadC [Planctomycetota bacterium]|nr:MAG: DNA repair protein RadC [Planctomycetota bacterium]
MATALQAGNGERRRYEELEDARLLALVLGREPEAELEAHLLRGGNGGPWHGRDPEELARELSVPLRWAEGLAAILELARRCAARKVALPEPVRGGRDVYLYFAPRFRGCRVERFCALYLDAKGRLLRERRVSEGTLTASLVHPREVYGPALVHQAAAVVVAHNHPSGDPEPSVEDHATTRRLQRAGRILGIELLDHVIVGEGRYKSFLENGWL